MATRQTKKQKIQNYIIKNPETGPAEIAKKFDCYPTYAGQIRRELAKAQPELGLPELKPGRKPKRKSKKAAVDRQERLYVPPAEPELEESWDAEGRYFETYDVRPSVGLFTRMLNALGLR